MTQEQFIYWLRGFISGKDYISTKEVDLLNEQLGKVWVIPPTSPIYIPPLSPTSVPKTPGYYPGYDVTCSSSSQNKTD